MVMAIRRFVSNSDGNTEVRMNVECGRMIVDDTPTGVLGKMMDGMIEMIRSKEMRYRLE
jgi:hypothetical protein